MQAPFYMTVVTIYFIILPFLLASSIFQAVKKRYKLHIKSQVAIFILTFIIILYFEIMIRIEGGFLYYKQYSGTSESFMLIYLIIHILIAIVGVILWAYLIFSSIKAYKHKNLDNKRHKLLGKIVFSLITISSIMGTGMYFMLFE